MSDALQVRYTNDPEVMASLARSIGYRVIFGPELVKNFSTVMFWTVIGFGIVSLFVGLVPDAADIPWLLSMLVAVSATATMLMAAWSAFKTSRIAPRPDIFDFETRLTLEQDRLIVEEKDDRMVRSLSEIAHFAFLPHVAVVNFRAGLGGFVVPWRCLSDEEADLIRKIVATHGAPVTWWNSGRLLGLDS